MTREEFVRRRFMNGECSEASFAIRGLEAYKNSFYPEGQVSWKKLEFERRSTERWTVDELIRRIRSDPEEDPIRVATMMLFDLMEQTNSTGNHKRSEIFRVASETTEELIDYMHCMF